MRDVKGPRTNKSNRCSPAMRDEGKVEGRGAEIGGEAGGEFDVTGVFHNIV